MWDRKIVSASVLLKNRRKKARITGVCFWKLMVCIFIFRIRLKTFRFVSKKLLMYQLLNAIICGAAFLLAFIISANQNRVNIKANRWFGIFVFCISLILLENIIIAMGAISEDAILSGLINTSNFMVAPVFYLSVCYYIEPIRQWKTSDYFHFSFAFLSLALLVISHLIDSRAAPEDISPENLQTATMLFNLIFSLYVFTYCFLAYRKISKHQNTIRLLNSAFENIDLKWLKNITEGVIFITFFWVFDILFKLSEGSRAFDLISSLIYLFGIFYIAYYWQQQKEIFPYELKEREEIETIIIETDLPEGKRKNYWLMKN